MTRAAPHVIVIRAATGLIVFAAAAVSTLVLPLLPPSRRVRVLQAFARALLRSIGVRQRTVGRLPRRGALLVANHVSWLDVLVLLSRAPVRVLAKCEIAGWPLIGRLTTAAGAVYIDRSRPRRLPATVAAAAEAIRNGYVVAVFPEGTTGCGQMPAAFRPAMFQAAIDAGAPVVPVVLRYFTAGEPTTAVAFVGDDSLLASVRRVIAMRDVHVCLTSHPALHPAAGVGRGALARTAAAVVAVPFLPVASPARSGLQPLGRTRPSRRADSPPTVDIAP
jgi:1-acyl-sn-glycerol-3-phosphate acyltransferase